MGLFRDVRQLHPVERIDGGLAFVGETAPKLLQRAVSASNPFVQLAHLTDSLSNLSEAVARRVAALGELYGLENMQVSGDASDAIVAQSGAVDPFKALLLYMWVVGVWYGRWRLTGRPRPHRTQHAARIMRIGPGTVLPDLSWRKSNFDSRCRATSASDHGGGPLIKPMSPTGAMIESAT